MGIDEGWEGCGLGFNHTQHDQHGYGKLRPKNCAFAQQLDHPSTLTRTVCYHLLRARADRVLIGACNPGLCPIWGFRNPVINPFRFPDMKKLVDYGHGKGVSMGWYLNGCACGEAFEHDINYEGDIRQLHALGFDAAKVGWNHPLPPPTAGLVPPP